MSRGFICLLIASLTLFAESCVRTLPTTQVIVAVHTDLIPEKEIDALQVWVLGPDDFGNEGKAHREFRVAKSPGKGKYAMPLSFSVAPKDNGSNEDFRLVVTGLFRGKAVVEQQAIASFRPGRSLQLVMFLARTCLDQLCRDEDGQRTEESCNPEADELCDEVKPREDLPEWRGPGAELDADVPPVHDASPDEPADARQDVSARDDASPDGAPRDAQPDGQRDSGEQASTRVCAVDETEREERPCCSEGRQNRTRTCLEDGSGFSQWSDWSACTAGECEPGSLDQKRETCGFCDKGTRTRTRRCTTSCTWDSFDDPPCSQPADACEPEGVNGSKGWRCCGTGMWEWCWVEGSTHECTWTGDCADCTDGPASCDCP